MNKVKRTTLILTISLTCFLAVIARGSDTIEVVTDGKGCFTFKHGTWVNNECFENYAAAKKAGDIWFYAWEAKQEFDRKTWVVISSS